MSSCVMFDNVTLLSYSHFIRMLNIIFRVYFDDGMVDPVRKDVEKSNKVSRECSPDQIKNASPRGNIFNTKC